MKNMQKYMEKRLTKGSRALGSLQKMMKYKTLVVYGCVSWILNQREVVSEIICLIKIDTATHDDQTTDDRQMTHRWKRQTRVFVH